MRAKQIRWMLSAVAYVILPALPEFGLAQTELARAQCDTIRLKLLKIGAIVRISFGEFTCFSPNPTPSTRSSLRHTIHSAREN